MKDVELVRKAKSGDKEAFSNLYASYYKEMYRYAYCILQNRQDAEDVVSDTVLDAYKSIKLLRDEKLFKNWIFKILSNKCNRKIASYYEKNSYYNENINETYENVNTEKLLDLKEAFKTLNFEEKCIVTYKSILGYSSKEIGEMLDLKEVTVRSKLSRAIGKLKCRMEA